MRPSQSPSPKQRALCAGPSSVSGSSIRRRWSTRSRRSSAPRPPRRFARLLGADVAEEADQGRSWRRRPTAAGREPRHRGGEPDTGGGGSSAWRNGPLSGGWHAADKVLPSSQWRPKRRHADPCLRRRAKSRATLRGLMEMLQHANRFARAAGGVRAAARRRASARPAEDAASWFCKDYLDGSRPVGGPWCRIRSRKRIGV